MQNEQKNSRKMSSAPILLPVIVLALSVQSCAHQEKTPVNEPAPSTTKAVEQQAAAQPESPAPPPAPILEKYSLDRLKQMSEKLASTKAFTYRANSFIELQAVTGQFLIFFIDSEVALQRPNKLRVNVSGDVSSFQLYFDGVKVSAFDPQKNFHAVSDPLATIDEMLDFVLTKAQINFPSADFMYSDPYAVMTKHLTHAIVVGPSMVNGVPCEHFAYMEPGINWEIWIENGKSALPLRLAMTYKQVPNFPRFLVEYSDWNLNPKLSADTFVFKKPPNSKQIEFGNYRAEQKTK
ncbi:MAG: DUF2092 domain-containing protein [Methylococcales bacterium]|nr:DUF2092 domain-containing protein [Methylococcales bacterium]